MFSLREPNNVLFEMGEKTFKFCCEHHNQLEHKKKEPKIISWLTSLMLMCLPLHTLACLHFKLFVQRVWMCVYLFRGDYNIFNVIQNVTHKTTGAHAHTACTEHYSCISFKLEIIPIFVCCCFSSETKIT